MATESDEEIIPPSDSGDSDYENTAEENYAPLSNPSDFGSESEQGSDNNEELLADPLGANRDGPNPYGLPEKPITNYDGDYEDQDDYFDGNGIVLQMTKILDQISDPSLGSSRFCSITGKMNHFISSTKCSAPRCLIQ